MAEVESFKVKVEAALRVVMKHAVTGHDEGEDTTDGLWHTYCNEPDHALRILADAGLSVVNEYTLRRVLDNKA